jgi:hypothetical protein
MAAEFIVTIVCVSAAVIACAAAVFTFLHGKRRDAAPAQTPLTPSAMETAATSWEPPSPTIVPGRRPAVKGTVEGLEMNLDKGGVVRRARVAAMNDEHRELVLTVSQAKWEALSASARQQAAIAARATWAAKVCGAGPDIAYVTIVTDEGDMVAQADPRSVRVS